MQAAEIRQRYLDFFQSKGHLVVPSSSLIPAGDPTLLLTTAGMVQMKPYFTGEMQPPRQRLTSVQKCFRVTDVESVGDASHLTLFEMLGNFSVGDYFKREAIDFAWEFMTEHLKLPKNQLWTTVFLDDDEAFGLWQKKGVPVERIRRLGEKDNFWGPAGDEGPCGPCSEIHIDFGGPCRLGKPTSECGPDCSCGRFLELWNLVFMQFYQDRQKKRTPLPKPNIDTGMGLERITRVLQNVPSVYDTDIFQPIIQRVCQLSGKQYGKDGQTDVAIRVVAEHARSASFLIADGVVPGNKGRGYVLRRLIRRAILFGQKIGLAYNPDHADSFLASVAEVVIQRLGSIYPELAQGRTFILRVLQQEEERFARTLLQGESLFNRYLDEMNRLKKDLDALEGNLIQAKNIPAAQQQAIKIALLFFSPFQSMEGLVTLQPSQTPEDVLRDVSVLLSVRSRLVSRFTLDEFKRIESGTSDFQLSQIREKLESTKESVRKQEKSLPGIVAFYLYDTYGFPVEVTAEVAQENGLKIDMDGFKKEMEAKSARDRAASGFGGDFEKVRPYHELGVSHTRFLGYDATFATSVVAAILVNGEKASTITAGQEAEVVLEQTSFYAEGGGQSGDGGQLEGPRGLFQVEDTQSPIAGLTVHKGKVVRGSIAVGENVAATIDPSRRNDAARNHTATHLLHAALRQVLGTHVRQQGSLVTPDRLRFDFTHVSAVSPQELREVEALVNDRIRANLPVHKRETTYRQAVAEGALAFFGDRYGDRVRVVEVGTQVVGAQGLAPLPHGPEPPFSYEVCGGTHINATGEIGLCLVLGESSVGAGLRRIEAITGRAAEAYVREQQALVNGLAQRLETSAKDLPTRIESLLEEAARLRKEGEARDRASSLEQAQALLAKATQVNGVKVVSSRASVSSVETLREIGDWLRDKLGSGVVSLGAVIDGRPVILVMASKDEVAKGVHAGNMVRDAAKVMGGGGGGRPDMAQGGGRDASKLDDALRAALETLKRQMQ